MSEMTPMASELTRKKCQPCEGGVGPLGPEQVATLSHGVPGWEVREGEIARTYLFKDYYQTVAFVNAVAWIAHRENHHPDLEVGYNTCRVRYSTHAVHGLSENDFICAAKVDALLR